MQILVNEAARTVRDQLTVAELVAELGLRAQQVAIEVNRELVPRGRHDSHKLAEGDAVEIVTLVGGG